ncbi:hypothetical protein AWZ03_015503, partial [Drosophila navojoa]
MIDLQGMRKGFDTEHQTAEQYLCSSYDFKMNCVTRPSCCSAEWALRKPNWWLGIAS